VQKGSDFVERVSVGFSQDLLHIVSQAPRPDYCTAHDRASKFLCLLCLTNLDALLENRPCCLEELFPQPRGSGALGAIEERRKFKLYSRSLLQFTTTCFRDLSSLSRARALSRTAAVCFAVEDEGRLLS
jgi:hypothetical protein